MDYIIEKDYLKTVFLKQGFKLEEETKESIRFKLRSFTEIHFSTENLISLKEYLAIRSEFENVNFETSLISKNYREELIEIINNINVRPFFRRGNKFVFGVVNDENIYSTIDSCSENYVWNKLENENFIKYILDRFSMIGSDKDFIQFTKRLSSIKIYNSNQTTAENNLRSTSATIDSCIFSLSSLKQTTIGVLENFPKVRRLRGQNKEIFKIHEGDNFNLPKIKINPHLLKFYQLASSTEFESHKFLSYYHILEYFFLSISDQNLYEKLSRRINDTRFKTNSQNLDKLIQDVNSHRTENDETEMLKNVLIKYINEDEVIEFIKEYEAILEDNIYTKKKILFGVEINGTNLQPGHVFGPIAKHIKTIRNAIVHSSDRHERNTRFIPYSNASMEVVKNEIPLLKFIAEKIIIASAE